MRFLVLLLLLVAPAAASAQVPISADGTDASADVLCTAAGTATRLHVACRYRGATTAAPEYDLTCVTRMTADFLPDAGLETLVECGDPRDGESGGAFALFAGAQLRWAFERGTEYGASVEAVNLIDRGEPHAQRLELILGLGTEDGGEVIVFAAGTSGMVRVFRANLGGGQGEPPPRTFTVALVDNDAHLEISGTGRRAARTIWRFDRARFAFLRTAR